jgi:hypothetical protein
VRNLSFAKKALVQTQGWRANDGRDAMVRPDRRSVQRPALRPTDHRFVRELIHELQTELADLVIMMADRGINKLLE